ncbi:MAG: cation transporter [Ruminiclostridium sp.]|nr:cation transporter [Ruminiclostridium sp.]
MKGVNMSEADRNNENEISRDKKIIRTSIIGIIANVMLAGFKAVMGIISSSIAITLDAVNNLSDAASSVITIAGTKLAGKSPDRKHPFGYGRVEYLSATVISLIVLYAGITSLTESVKKIFEPETPDYSPTVLIIIGVAVAVKIVLGRYVKSVGVSTNSDSLINSGEDATLDSIISASTLAAAAVYMIWNIQLEAWLGAIISGVIIKSGIEMLTGTLSQILGESADAETARGIKETICSFPEVEGAYDLVLNNYGPDRFNGSVHIEIPDTCTATRIDELIREITYTVYEKYNIVLTGISIYAVSTTDAEAIEMRSALKEIIAGSEYVPEFHALSVQKEARTARFDLVVSLDAPDRAKELRTVVEKMKSRFPDYTFYPVIDTDFTER